MGFVLGERGYEFIAGPSGAGGHGVTTSGFDGVAYNPRTGDLILGDNKTFKRVGNVVSATAIDPEKNLQKNLKGMIAQIENHPNLGDFPNRSVVLQRLKTADQGLAAWIKGGRQGSPNLRGVRLMVFNAGGNSTGVGGKLARTGVVQFEDLNASPRVRVAQSAATDGAKIRVAADDTRIRIASDPPETPRATVISETEGLETPRVRRRAPRRRRDRQCRRGPGAGFLQSAMKDKIKTDLANLPQPRPDPRGASTFLKDPTWPGPCGWST